MQSKRERDTEYGITTKRTCYKWFKCFTCFSNRRLFSYLIAALLFLSPAQALNSYDTQRLEDGIRLCDEGHFANAIRVLTGVNQRNPTNVFVLCQLGHAHMNNSEDLTHSTAIAEKCFRKSIEIDPQYGRGYKKLAEWYIAHGDWRTAIQLATKALAVKKPDNSALLERAGAYSSLHKDKEALADLDLFIAKVGLPKEKRHKDKILLQRAAILENMKQYDKAVVVYRALLKEHFEDSLVFREVACLRAMHKPDEALKSLKNLLEKNKADDVGYVTRARLYQSLGRYKEALSDFATAIDLAPSTTYYKERAALYEKMGRKDLAEKDRKEADRL